MTSYTLRNASPAKTRAEALVVGVVQGPKGPELAAGGEDVAKAYGRRLRPLLAGLGVTGKAGEVVRFPTQGALNASILVLVGLGEVGVAGPDDESVRRAAGVAARSVPNAASVALALPADTPGRVGAVTAGHALGGYAFTRYKARPADDGAGGRHEPPAEAVVLSPAARRKEVVAAFEDAQVVAEAVATARDWVNTAPGDLAPVAFAEAAVEATRQVTTGRGTPTIKTEVLDEQQLAALGCGGILGVGKGSSVPPRLVRLTYAPRGAKTHLALVGKGITFDSGGLSIKPASSMPTMKSDMAGAAAVITATHAIARLGLPIKVTTFAPMAENMISGEAIRPGDVLTIHGGKTVEVLNTDAEGRLILADALVMAGETNPDVVVDVATLTGAMVVALGERVSGVLGDDDVVAALQAAGERAGEAHWPMPITDEVVERVGSSKVADLLQTDLNRLGGGLYAAAFLRAFVDGPAWGHLDIAGPAFREGAATGYLTPGGTGFAVATLVEYARELAAR